MFEQIDSAVQQEDTQGEPKDGASIRPERDIENQEEEKRQVPMPLKTTDKLTLYI